PKKHLEGEHSIQQSVQVGSTTHQLTASGASGLEMYEFPGEYSRHFDGITKTGGEQPDHLNWIFQENLRTATVRMEQEAVGAIQVEATSGHPGMMAGDQFSLEGHFSDDGKFVLTSVDHSGKQPIGVQGDEHEYEYENRITCIPFALPYRPQR